MEKFVAYIFSIGFMLSITGCKGQNSSLNESDSDIKISMIIFDIYKGTIDNSLSLIYSCERRVILIKSNGLQSLDFQEIPPPPLNEKKPNYNGSNRNSVKIEAEVLNMEKGTVEKIQSLIEGFEENDLKTIINSVKIEDGIAINVTIVYSENSIKDFTLINGATENQRKFLRYIFDQVIHKSKFNKEKLKLFLQ